jgi:hypothetical protein
VVALEGGEGVPVGALAVEVDGQDGFDVAAGGGAEEFGDGGFGREVEGAGVDVGEEGRAPARRMALAEAKKLKGVVMTASVIPVSARDSFAGSGRPGADAGGGEGQPEGVGAAGASDGVGEAQAVAAAASNAATWGPRMKCCESQTWAMASRISCRSGANWREKSSIGTGCGVGCCEGTEQWYNAGGLRLLRWMRV